MRSVLLRLRACRLLCAHGRWPATTEYRHRLRSAEPRIRDSEEAGRTSLSPVDTRGPMLTHLEVAADVCCSHTGVSHAPSAVFCVWRPLPVSPTPSTSTNSQGTPNSIYPRQVLITAQLMRVRRKTYGTDERHITGARAPATRVLPHEASPLSGEPASPCEGAVPGTRHDTDGRYM